MLTSHILPTHRVRHFEDHNNLFPIELGSTFPLSNRLLLTVARKNTGSCANQWANDK